MIFNTLFGRKKKEKDVQSDGAARSDSGRQADDTPAVGAGFVEKTAGKTTSVKRGRAVGGKRRLNRPVHTARSFHNRRGRPVKDRVNVYDVIDRPAVTEKAATLSEKGVYVFLVRPSATKHTVVDAVEAIYNVRPRKVHISVGARKQKRIRVSGREREYSFTTRKKKAYVFLKKGDTIQLT